MTNPVFWLGLSIVLLAIGLATLVGVSLPALLGLARAARSAERLFDTLDRELPRTLEAMRNTGADLRDLADDMTDGVHSARNIVKQVDTSLSDVRQQAQQAQRTSRSLAVGVRAAWRVLTKPKARRRPKAPNKMPNKMPNTGAAASKAPTKASPEAPAPPPSPRPQNPISDGALANATESPQTSDD